MLLIGKSLPPDSIAVLLTYIVLLSLYHYLQIDLGFIIAGFQNVLLRQIIKASSHTSEIVPCCGFG